MIRALSKAALILALLLLLNTARTSADTIVKSFNTKTKIDPGYVVNLSKDDPEVIELTPANYSGQPYGVVVEQTQAAVTLQRPTQTTYVATSGDYSIRVSLEKGPIKAGDYLSMSGTEGVAAEASGDQEYIIGRAEQAFDAGSKADAKDSKGNSIGLIAAQISPNRNPSSDNDPFTKWLKQVAKSLGGKPVKTTQVYAVFAIFIISLSLAVGLVWVGVQTSITAIGRNPLSKHLIMQSLTRALGLALVLFGGGLVAIYLLLKL